MSEASPDATAEAASADANPNREAAKYRTQLREVEAERDELAAKLAAFEKAEQSRALLKRHPTLSAKETELLQTLPADQVEPFAEALTAARQPSLGERLANMGEPIPGKPAK